MKPCIFIYLFIYPQKIYRASNITLFPGQWTRIPEFNNVSFLADDRGDAISPGAP